MSSSLTGGKPKAAAYRSSHPRVSSAMIPERSEAIFRLEVSPRFRDLLIPGESASDLGFRLSSPCDISHGFSMSRGHFADKLGPRPPQHPPVVLGRPGPGPYEPRLLGLDGVVPALVDHRAAGADGTCLLEELDGVVEQAREEDGCPHAPASRRGHPRRALQQVLDAGAVSCPGRRGVAVGDGHRSRRLPRGHQRGRRTVALRPCEGRESSPCHPMPTGQSDDKPRR